MAGSASASSVLFLDEEAAQLVAVLVIGDDNRFDDHGDGDGHGRPAALHVMDKGRDWLTATAAAGIGRAGGDSRGKDQVDIVLVGVRAVGAAADAADGGVFQAGARAFGVGRDRVAFIADGVDDGAVIEQRYRVRGAVLDEVRVRARLSRSQLATVAALAQMT